MGFRQVDLAALFRDTGLLLTLGPSSTYGFVDRVGVAAVSGVGTAVGALRIRLTIETGTLTGLVAGALVTVGTTSYRVREIHAVGDGATTEILCERG